MNVFASFFPDRVSFYPPKALGGPLSHGGVYPGLGANGTWVTLYYQDMGYSFGCRAAGFLPLGNA